jgi:hypothetical protein
MADFSPRIVLEYHPRGDTLSHVVSYCGALGYEVTARENLENHCVMLCATPRRLKYRV